jgi:hypothetical protein
MNQHSEHENHATNPWPWIAIAGVAAVATLLWAVKVRNSGDHAIDDLVDLAEDVCHRLENQLGSDFAHAS